jgi:hypothetical protein
VLPSFVSGFCSRIDLPICGCACRGILTHGAAQPGPAQLGARATGAPCPPHARPLPLISFSHLISPAQQLLSLSHLSPSPRGALGFGDGDRQSFDPRGELSLSLSISLSLPPPPFLPPCVAPARAPRAPAVPCRALGRAPGRAPDRALTRPCPRPCPCPCPGGLAPRAPARFACPRHAQRALARAIVVALRSTLVLIHFNFNLVNVLRRALRRATSHSKSVFINVLCRAFRRATF